MTLGDKEKVAIQRLKAFEPQTEPYFLCYSGGKDSDAIRILAELAGVKFEIHHNLTTVDAPETIKYVKSVPGVVIDKAHYEDGTQKTMWNLIVKKGLPPIKKARYCCSELKENGGKWRIKITGVRAQESINRRQNSGLVKIIGKPKTTKKNAEKMGIQYDETPQGGLVLNFDNSESRRFVEQCYRTTSTMVNPIIDWSEDEVWEFLKHYGCEGNPLYKCGEKRIGCIGCPMQGYKKMQEELNKYPKYKQAYIHAFGKMLEKREEKGKPTYNWKNAKDVYNWWVGLDKRGDRSCQKVTRKHRKNL